MTKYVARFKSKATGEVYTLKDSQLDTKQDVLVSGENIKTINNQSILGDGNIEIGGGTVDYDQLDNRPQIAGVTLTGNKSADDLGLVSESKFEDVLYKPVELTPYELSPEKTAISSSDGTVVTVSGSQYQVKTFEIDPSKTYLVSAFAYSAAYAYYSYYKVVNEQEVPISWKSYSSSEGQILKDKILTDIPSDATLIKVGGNTHSSYKTPAVLKVLENNIELLDERCSALEPIVNKDNEVVDEMFKVI